jgi:hypothetical protein
MAVDLYIALIHHPVTNKAGRVVTTAVTNFDIHDLARTGRTFGVKTVFLVTPVAAQQEMVRFIRDYWQEGYGAAYNPSRKQATQILAVAATLEDARLTIEKASGTLPLLVATTAKKYANSISYARGRGLIGKGNRPVLLAFGTGYGLTPDFLAAADAVLEPIAGSEGFNHLPVRAAAAIVLDRLIGR